MKRRIVLLLCLSLLLTSPALAGGADGYWTGNDDIYYHAVENCCGVEERVPISLAGAAEFEKAPCPVCLSEEDDGSAPTAVARGGVICIRFSDAWLARRELTGVFGFAGSDIYEGSSAQRELSELLHGDAYADFLAGGGEAWALVPDVLEIDAQGQESCRVLGRRHIGSAWYVLVQPRNGFGESWSAYWRVNAERVQWVGGALELSFERQSVEETLPLIPERLEGDAIFTTTDVASGLSAEIYAAGEVYVTVLHVGEEYADFLEDVRLYAGENWVQDVNGSASGDGAVYYAILTQAETDAVRAPVDEKLLSLRRAPLSEGVDFGDDPYADVAYGTSGRRAIIDRAGDVVTGLEYAAIQRPGYSSLLHQSSVPRPFFCRTEAGTWTILDGETLDVIVEGLKDEPYYINPALFRTGNAFFGEPGSVYSLEDGEKKFDIGASEAYDYMDGDYRIRAEGCPRRLVAWRGSGANVLACLMDDEGELLPETVQQRLTPLYWTEAGRGVFLAERFEAAEFDEAKDVTEREDIETWRYRAAERYGEHWRCGLVDENGSALTELKYIAIECDADGNIRLTAEDGSEEAHTLDELLGKAS